MSICMHLSQKFQNLQLFYTACCSPYNLLVTGVFKVPEYTSCKISLCLDVVLIFKTIVR